MEADEEGASKCDQDEAKKDEELDEVGQQVDESE